MEQGRLGRFARPYMGRERPDHILQPTALVHETYMRLADFCNLSWKNRVHFFAISAQVMRRVPVDLARSRERRKRGGVPGLVAVWAAECAHPDCGPTGDYFAEGLVGEIIHGLSPKRWTDGGCCTNRTRSGSSLTSGRPSLWSDS
jgi:hypothetical protein